MQNVTEKNILVQYYNRSKLLYDSLVENITWVTMELPINVYSTLFIMKCQVCLTWSWWPLTMSSSNGQEMMVNSVCVNVGIYSDKNNRKFRDFQTKAFVPNVTFYLCFSGSRIPQFSDDGQRLYLIYLPPNAGHLYGHWKGLTTFTLSTGWAT